MCARYELRIGDAALQPLLEALARQGISWRGGEVYPSASAPVLLEAAGELVPSLKCWGYPWPGRRPVINARAETLLERPMFRESAQHRRCAVPASAFFEWDAARQKFRFTRSDGAPLYLAGVWERRDGVDCFCIVTTEASADVAQVHERMPRIFTEEQMAAWLRGTEPPEALLRAPAPPLLCQRADGQLGLW